MYDLQYNRNTFNPHLKKQWVHSRRCDTAQQCEDILKIRKNEFLRIFGYANAVQYRIVKAKQCAKLII